ncbi:MlaD family protein [Thermocrispum municipale]|jgi:phospholipid/cholesterol/gamma-HCH transport system substrate-binding protein|uniref:MlaD family protein n=1 Tax=Thermocrispum municipale TaxID=37926 RepID=UPI000407C900|nr:MlaD family protein [Thermocrispum municipale]
MLTRKTKLQLVAFVLISCTALVYALFRFTDVGKMVGDSGYTVMVRMPDTGGVFPDGEVTYRGYNIGRIGDMRLTERGVEIDLNIEPDTPPIPDDVQAVAMNRSAVGEQLIDLRPRRAGGPYLKDGSVITDTKRPPGTDDVIEELTQLADSVPTDSLRTVVDESYNAFAGDYGKDLQVLMDTSREFVKGARQNLPDLRQLLDSGNQVLRTQNEEFDHVRSFTRDLRKVSSALKGSDADLRKLIDQVPSSARQLSEVVDEIGPGTSHVIANLITVGRIADTRLDGLEQAFVTYPALSAGAVALLKGDRPEAPLGLTLNLFDPPPCVKGYEKTQRRPGDDIKDDPPYNKDAYCAEPKGSPINVRGSLNAPYNGIPVGEATDEEVAANANRDQESLEQQRGMDGHPDLELNRTVTSFGGMLGLG